MSKQPPTVIKRGSVTELPTDIKWNRAGEGEASMAQPSQKCNWAAVNGVYVAMSFLPTNNDRLLESVASATASAVEEAMNGPYGMDGDVSVFYVPGAIVAAVVID